jgi:hypothetical protein
VGIVSTSVIKFTLFITLLSVSTPVIEYINNNKIIVVLPTLPNHIVQCLRGSLDTKIHFKISVCQKQKYWIDSCGEQLMADNLANYDPITDIYTIEQDKKGDKLPSVITEAPNLKIASKLLGKSLEISYSEISNLVNAYKSPEKHYLKYEVIGFCHENYNAWADKIMSIMSLGLLEIPHYSSGEYVIPLNTIDLS